MLRGVPASPGRGHGAAHVIRQTDLRFATAPVQDREQETVRLEQALERVAARLSEQAAAAQGELASILDAQSAMALDPELTSRSAAMIMERGRSAAIAVIEVGEAYATSLEASDNAYLAARAADVRDVCRQVAANLLGVQAAEPPAPGEPQVLIAKDITPAQMAGFDPSAIAAVATESGSRTSHTAIAARALGIPAVVAVAGLLDTVSTGTHLLVDGESGEVHIQPEAATVSRLTAPDFADRAAWRPAIAEAVTRDGHRVELGVNAGGVEEVRRAVVRGARSVGLYRTELAYLGAREPPTEEAQVDALEEMARLLGGGRLIVRTFDFGADKAPAFLAPSAEPNPALGVRGIRLARAHPELLGLQLRAVARSAGAGRVAVMAPMITTVEEAEWFWEACAQAGCQSSGIEVGAMVEVPSAVFVAAELAQRLDFLSIGTNDLCQYVHAADRQLGALAEMQDPFAPALLRGVAQVSAAAAGTKAWVGVCGEAASDPLWALVAVGLGVTELSMEAARLEVVGNAIAAQSLAGCQALAAAALAAPGAASARRAAEAGLGG